MDAGDSRRLGAPCVMHEARDAVFTCARCGDYRCGECRAGAWCRECGARADTTATLYCPLTVDQYKGVRAASVLGNLLVLISVVQGVISARGGTAAHVLTAIVAGLGLVLLIVGHFRARSRNVAGGPLRWLRSYWALTASAQLYNARRFDETVVKMEAVLPACVAFSNLHAAALQNLAVAWMATGNAEPALPLLRAADASGWLRQGKLRARNGYALHSALALANAAVGHLDEAERYYEAVRAQSTAPIHAGTAYLEIFMLARRGEYARVIDDFEARLATLHGPILALQAPVMCLLRAFALAQLGRPEAEVRDALATIAPPYDFRGVCQGWPELRDFITRNLPTARVAP